MKTAMSSGFRQIAGFIFGNNTGTDGTKNQKVAMTAPVTMETSKK